MRISQDLYDKLVKKQFYKFICSDALYNCFKHYGENQREIIDILKLKNTLNKFKIFQYSVDYIDFDIFTLLHHEINHGETSFVDIIKPSIIENRTLWLESNECSEISIIASNTEWNVDSKIL